MLEFVKNGNITSTSNSTTSTNRNFFNQEKHDLNLNVPVNESSNNIKNNDKDNNCNSNSKVITKEYILHQIFNNVGDLIDGM